MRQSYYSVPARYATRRLEVLTRKPGALAGATALVKARAAGAFSPEHQRFWDGARKVLGDQGGTRALVGMLLLRRTLPAAAVIKGMAAAVSMGRFEAELVAVEARGGFQWVIDSRGAGS